MRFLKKAICCQVEKNSFKNKLFFLANFVGFLDDLEKKYLQESIGDGRRTLRSLTVVTPNSPEYIVKSVPWLLDEEDAASFLLVRN